LFADCISLDFIILKLLPIVQDNFFNLLMNPVDVVTASFKPFLLTVVFKLEDSIRNNLMNEISILNRNIFRFSFSIYVKMHGDEQDVLIEA
jgi:hypothetical protein